LFIQLSHSLTNNLTTDLHSDLIFSTMWWQTTYRHCSITLTWYLHPCGNAPGTYPLDTHKCMQVSRLASKTRLHFKTTHTQPILLCPFSLWSINLAEVYA